MSARPNLAQRAARWSASHRRIAIFGWIALVLVSVFLGACGRHPVPRRRGPRQRGVQACRPDPGRCRIQRSCQRGGADPVRGRPPDGARPGVQGRDRRRRRAPAHVPHGHGDQVAAAAPERGPDLERRTLGARRLRHPRRRRSRRGARGPDPRRRRRARPQPPAAADRAVRRRERRQGHLQGLRGRLPQGRDPVPPDHARHPRRDVRRAGRRGAAAAARASRRWPSRSACWRWSARRSRWTRRSRR